MTTLGSVAAVVWAALPLHVSLADQSHVTLVKKDKWFWDCELPLEVQHSIFK